MKVLSMSEYFSSSSHLLESVKITNNMNKVEKEMYTYYNSHTEEKMFCYKFTSMLVSKLTGQPLNKIMSDAKADLKTENDTEKTKIIKSGQDYTKGVCYAIVKNGLGSYIDYNKAVAGDFVQVYYIPKFKKDVENYITKESEIPKDKVSLKIETGIFNDKNFYIETTNPQNAINFLKSTDKKGFVKSLFNQKKVVLSSEELNDIKNNEQKLLYLKQTESEVHGHSCIVKEPVSNNILKVCGYGALYGANFFGIKNNSQYEFEGQDYTNKYSAIPIKGNKDYDTIIYVARLDKKYL